MKRVILKRGKAERLEVDVMGWQCAMVIELKAEQLNLLNRYLEPVMTDTRNLKDAGPARAA